jgi:hypothetical protein
VDKYTLKGVKIFLERRYEKPKRWDRRQLQIISEYKYLFFLIKERKFRCSKLCRHLFSHWLFQLIQGPGLLFSSVSFFTDDTTPWTSDQPIIRPLPKHTKTQTQNKRIHTSNIHALSGIRTNNPNMRASEERSCFRLPGYGDRLCRHLTS